MKVFSRKNATDISLFIISITMLVCALIASKEFESVINKFALFNELIFNLSCGWLISYIFYLLVVRFPEMDRKSVIRKSLEARYREFCVNCIGIFLDLADGGYEADFPNNLLDKNKFRNYFKSTDDGGGNRWYLVANKLDDYHIRRMNVEIDALTEEIDHSLIAIEISDLSFVFFKELSYILKSSKIISTDYDDIKTLLRLFWSILSSDEKEDIIQRHIERM